MNVPAVDDDDQSALLIAVNRCAMMMTVRSFSARRAQAVQQRLFTTRIEG